MNNFETAHEYTIETALEKLDRADLQALIKQMIQLYPDLAELLKKEEPSASQAQHISFNAEASRLQIEKIFYTTDRNKWGSEARAAGPLLDIKETADEYVKQRHYADAVALYEMIMQGVFDNYDSFCWHAEEGELDNVVEECVDGLSNCLIAEQGNSTLRQQIIKTLCTAYQFDMELDNDEPVFSRNIPTILIKQTTSDERHIVAQWLRKTFDLDIDWDTDDVSDDYDDFLLGLEADTLDDETFLRISRETENYNYLVERLLKLGRREAALEAARHADSYDIPDIANIIRDYGYEDDAIHLVEELAEKASSYKTKLLGWLQEQYQAKGNSTNALETASRIFYEHPFAATIERYREIRLLAQQIGQWEEMRSELLIFLKQGKNTSLQIEIALDEGLVAHALELLQSERQTKDPHNGPYGGNSFDVGLAVAQAAEKDYPEAAIEIYQRYTDTRVEWRGRENYATACQYLITIRKIYQNSGKKDGWQTYIAKFLEKNRNLPALKDEMKKAKV